MYKRQTFTNNKAAASVVDTGSSSGGFTGADKNSTFNKCIASGNVEAGDWNVGGFGGYSEGTWITAVSYTHLSLFGFFII